MDKLLLAFQRSGMDRISAVGWETLGAFLVSVDVEVSGHIADVEVSGHIADAAASNTLAAVRRPSVARRSSRYCNHGGALEVAADDAVAPA